MTREQNVKFLISLGVPKERAEKMSKAIPDTAEETPETEVDEVLSVISSHQIDLFKNGDDFKKELKSVADKKIAEITSKSEKKIISISGLTTEEIKNKKFDEIVELAWQKAAKMGDKTAEEIQKELNKVHDKVREYEEVIIPKLKSENESELKNIKKRTGALKEIGNLKLRKGIDMEDAYLLAEQKAARLGYVFSLDDKDNFIITMQDGSKIFTEDKRGYLSTSQVLNNILESMIEKSNPNPDPDPKKIKIKKDEGDETKPTTVLAANLKRAQDHAKSLEEK